MLAEHYPSTFFDPLQLISKVHGSPFCTTTTINDPNIKDLTNDLGTINTCMDHQVQIEFQNKATYIGTTKNKQMHGNGTYTWPDKTKYTGEFQSNMIHGTGQYTWPDSSTYNGQVKFNFRCGEGELRLASGLVATGTWINGKLNGQGTITYPEGGGSYTGEFKYGMYDGQGTRVYKSGTKYIGTFVNGNRHGFGMLVQGQVVVYEGGWVNGLMHGQGTYVWPTTMIHQGASEFGNVGMDMLGAVYERTNKYTGEFLDGYRHGKGVVQYADGAEYSGEFVMNKKHGVGQFTTRFGHLYTGMFDSDRMIGQDPWECTDLALRYKLVIDNEQHELGSMIRRHMPILTKRYTQYAQMQTDLLNTTKEGMSKVQWHVFLLDVGLRKYNNTIAQVDRLVPIIETLRFGKYLSALVTVAGTVYKPICSTKEPGWRSVAFDKFVSLDMQQMDNNKVTDVVWYSAETNVEWKSVADQIKDARLHSENVIRGQWDLFTRRDCRAFWTVYRQVTSLLNLEQDINVAHTLRSLCELGELDSRHLQCVIALVSVWNPSIVVDKCLNLDYPLVPIEQFELLFELYASIPYFPVLPEVRKQLVVEDRKPFLYRPLPPIRLQADPSATMKQSMSRSGSAVKTSSLDVNTKNKKGSMVHLKKSGLKREVSLSTSLSCTLKPPSDVNETSISKHSPTDGIKCDESLDANVVVMERPFLVPKFDESGQIDLLAYVQLRFSKLLARQGGGGGHVRFTI